MGDAERVGEVVERKVRVVQLSTRRRGFWLKRDQRSIGEDKVKLSNRAQTSISAELMEFAERPMSCVKDVDDVVRKKNNEAHRDLFECGSSL